MKELILVRHGEAEHLMLGLTGGWTDRPLTGRGRAQAALVADRLAAILGQRNFELYCSDFQRTHETARIIGQAAGRPPIPVPALRDANNGIAVDMVRAEALKIRLPMTEPLIDWIAYPGGESWRAMMQRVGMFVGELLERDAPVGILVTHRNVIAGLVQWWLRLNDELISTTDFDAEPASLAILSTAYWGGRVISRLNDTAHLR